VLPIERSVDHGALAGGKPESHPFGAGAKALGAEQHPRVRQAAEHFSDARDQCRARDGARFPVRVGLVHDDEAHRRHARNSTAAGVRTAGFTLCVCPASSPYRAPGTTPAIAFAASRSRASVFDPFITSTGTPIDA